MFSSTFFVEEGFKDYKLVSVQIRRAELINILFKINDKSTLKLKYFMF